MFKKLNVLDEADKRLRLICNEVKEPLSKNELKLIDDMLLELKYSQIEELSKKYDLRPGMGLAFPQLGLNKRLIVIVHEYESGKFKNYVVVNPKIMSYSEELIAASEGEGCLSVNREVEGHVPRYARVTIEGLDTNLKPIKMRAREELSIAFQHEVDHLNGILFYDRIDPNKPFYGEEEIRLI